MFSKMLKLDCFDVVSLYTLQLDVRLYSQEFHEIASNFIKLLFHCFTNHYNLSVRLRIGILCSC